MSYSVKRAVVTGAARGIGAAIAERLSSDGLDVAILDLDGTRAQQTADRIAGTTAGKLVAHGCDVADRRQVQEVIGRLSEELGGLDTLICNAGITRDAFLHKMTDEQWDEVVSVHLTGTFACIRAVAPRFREQGNCRIVCISSVAGAAGNAGQLNYSAAKAGIVGMVKTAAREFARSRTTVNAVRPGFIDTDMTRAIPDTIREQMLQAIPLARPGQPEEVAGVVSFYCSDDAAYVTGTVLDVNGGSYM